MADVTLVFQTNTGSSSREVLSDFIRKHELSTSFYYKKIKVRNLDNISVVF